MKTILAIIGPTGVGKTRLAEEIQENIDSGLRRNDKRIRTELISIDSRQVYRGMDIGTGKDVGVFGTDLVKPNKLFNVSDFAKIVKPEIKKLWKKNVLPILVGGTGLYLHAIIDEIETIDIPPNKELRKELEKMTIEELQEKLFHISKTTPYVIPAKAGILKRIQDPSRSLPRRDLRGWDDPPSLAAGKLRKGKQENCGMNNSDWNNSRRLIRKIEILTNTNQCHPILTNTNKLKYSSLLIIGLTAPLPQLKKNIELRVQSRLDKGLLEEIKGLVEKYGWNEVLRNTIAYKEWENYFNNKEKYEEVIAKWTLDEINYAKRQMTWFKKDTRIVWLQENYLKESLKLIEERKLLFQNLCNS